jgi:putative lipase involved disintegration of autophagic bodies
VVPAMSSHRLCWATVSLTTILLLLSLLPGARCTSWRSTGDQSFISSKDIAVTEEVQNDEAGLWNEFTYRYSFIHDLQDLSAPAQFDSIKEALVHSGNLIQPQPFAIKRDPHGLHELAGASMAPKGPDVTDRATVINLAKMTSDAYVMNPSQPDWLNTTLKFNYSSSFGWEGEGLRGHLFSDRWNKTVIVAFKGTTVDPREKWRYRDRVNDNILFSCCCGAQQPDPYPYAPVCECSTGTYQCNSTCLAKELAQEDRYYATALGVMFNITHMFPDSDIWLVGHSLGGAVASLMGHTFDFPVVTFEAPPERLPTKRLALLEKTKSPIYHIGNTADPIYMGACSGWSSSCGLAGYAFESQCFTGKVCQYNTVIDKGWSLSIANHRINTVITEVLEKYNLTPPCVVDEECVECYNWNFADG